MTCEERLHNIDRRKEDTRASIFPCCQVCRFKFCFPTSLLTLGIKQLQEVQVIPLRPVVSSGDSHLLCNRQSASPKAAPVELRVDLCPVQAKDYAEVRCALVCRSRPQCIGIATLHSSIRALELFHPAAHDISQRQLPIPGQLPNLPPDIFRCMQHSSVYPVTAPYNLR